jgi:hypothetical protein
MEDDDLWVRALSETITCQHSMKTHHRDGRPTIIVPPFVPHGDAQLDVMLLRVRLAKTITTQT